GGEPGRVNSRGAEGVAEDITEEGGLGGILGVPRGDPSGTDTRMEGGATDPRGAGDARGCRTGDRVRGGAVEEGGGARDAGGRLLNAAGDVAERRPGRGAGGAEVGGRRQPIRKPLPDLDGLPRARVGEQVPDAAAAGAGEPVPLAFARPATEEVQHPA